MSQYFSINYYKLNELAFTTKCQVKFVSYTTIKSLENFHLLATY